MIKLSLWTSVIYELSTLFYSNKVCILDTQYQNTLVFNWTLYYSGIFQFPLEFICVTIVHLMCYIPYC